MNENTCKVKNCSSKIHACGFCKIHYMRNHRYGSTEKKKTKRQKLLEIGMSYCPRCKLSKPIGDFYKSLSRKFGNLSTYCKICSSEKGKSTRPRYSKTLRNTYLKKAYGISNEDYERMLEKQNNSCAICGKICSDKEKFPVDHDHKTKKVRGILCHVCNKGLGCFYDDISKLESAIKYLQSPTISHAA